MTESMIKLLLRLSEAGDAAILWGRQAAPHAGREFDRLLVRGVLVEQAPAIEWDVCASCECELDVRPIQTVDGRLVAACPLDRMNDAVLDSEDLRTFSINMAALAREIAAASGLANEPLMIANGVWRIGLTPSKRTVFLAFSRFAVMQDGLLPTLRSVAQLSQISILTPALSTQDATRLTDAGVHLVPTSTALETDSTNLGVVINWAKLEPAPQSPKLLINYSSGAVHASGRSVTLSHQLAPVFRRLVDKARSRDPVVSGREVEGTSGREAKDLIRELRDAFKSGGMTDHEAKILIANVRSRGWRIGLEASEIMVEG